MKRYLALTLFLLTPFAATSQVAMDSLTCFTPTQLKLIVQDIEKGEHCLEKISLKDEQILNLEAQISARDNIIEEEQRIKSLTESAHRAQLSRRTLSSFLLGSGSGALLVLLLVL